jgi:hypothetical protein
MKSKRGLALVGIIIAVIALALVISISYRISNNETSETGTELIRIGTVEYVEVFICGSTAPQNLGPGGPNVIANSTTTQFNPQSATGQMTTITSIETGTTTIYNTDTLNVITQDNTTACPTIS